jgi:hypothetical protein
MFMIIRIIKGISNQVCLLLFCERIIATKKKFVKSFKKEFQNLLKLRKFNYNIIIKYIDYKDYYEK